MKPSLASRTSVVVFSSFSDTLALIFLGFMVFQNPSVRIRGRGECCAFRYPSKSPATKNTKRSLAARIDARAEAFKSDHQVREFPTRLSQLRMVGLLVLCGCKALNLPWHICTVFVKKSGSTGTPSSSLGWRRKASAQSL